MKKIHIVLDNYNTHNPKNFYEHFEPEVANRLTKKFVFHFTPKHASWLNMAEIELSDARLKLKKLYPTIEEK